MTARGMAKSASGRPPWRPGEARPSHYRYIYDGERVLEQTNFAWGALTRFTTENDSYYGTLLHFAGANGHRFPIYD